MSLIYISKVIHPQDMSNLHEYTEQFVSMNDFRIVFFYAFLNIVSCKKKKKKTPQEILGH